MTITATTGSRREGEINMSAQRFRVGIVGLQPGRSWAAVAHIPALRALSDTYEIVGVANTSQASAQAAASATGLPRAFSDVAELVSSPDVDIVAITVKVPHHLEIAKAAIAAGKHVYCEWPLGNGLTEAEELAALARARGVLGVVGTQARAAPEIEYLRHLIADGFVGQVLSTTLLGQGGGWGGIIGEKKIHAYLLDRANGATLLTIPVGHTLAALRDVLGEVTTVSATLATRRTTARAADTGETLPVSAPDQVLVSGTLSSGAPVCLHYRGGAPRDGQGFFWEINGTEGDIRVTAPAPGSHADGAPDPHRRTRRRQDVPSAGASRVVPDRPGEHGPGERRARLRQAGPGPAGGHPHRAYLRRCGRGAPDCRGHRKGNGDRNAHGGRVDRHACAQWQMSGPAGYAAPRGLDPMPVPRRQPRC
jgi:predicted dehydrogenase